MDKEKEDTFARFAHTSVLLDEQDADECRVVLFGCARLCCLRVVLALCVCPVWSCACSVHLQAASTHVRMHLLPLCLWRSQPLASPIPSLPPLLCARCKWAVGGGGDMT